jgi:hypothetical protein
MEDHTATDEIEFDDDTTLSEIFFDHIFQSIVGRGKLMDEYFSDLNANFYDTVQHANIVCHDETADNPDWKVRKCYTLLIA